MSAYKDQFDKAKKEREEQEKRKAQEEEQRLQRQQEIANAKCEEQHRKALQLIDKFDPEIRKMLWAYGEVHLKDNDSKLSVSDEPEIGYDKKGWIENASWHLTSIIQPKLPPELPEYVHIDISFPRSRKATITISLRVSRHFLFWQRVRGFQISGTDGRERVRPSLSALSTALAESRPKWWAL